MSPLADPTHFTLERVVGSSAFQSFESPLGLGPCSSPSLCLVGGVAIEVERFSPVWVSRC